VQENHERKSRQRDKKGSQKSNSKKVMNFALSLNNPININPIPGTPDSGKKKKCACSRDAYKMKSSYWVCERCDKIDSHLYNDYAKESNAKRKCVDPECFGKLTMPIDKFEL
jgi:hypothetical protein